MIRLPIPASPAVLASLVALPLALAACGQSAGSDTAAAAAPAAAAKAPAGQSWTETVTKTAEGYRMGNPDAPIKLVEYGARTCPTCGAFARDGFSPLTTQYVASGKVSFEFRDFLVHGAPDLAATLLGECAGTAPFFPILEQMYQNQSTFLDKLQAMSPAVQQQLQGMAPNAALPLLAEQMGAIEFVKQRGVSESAARQCLSDQKHIEALAKVTEDATSSGTVAGTPTFILNGKTLADTVSWPDVEKALKAAGA